jgi:hypothetical protein
MNSILDHIGPEHIHSDPFHYLTTSEALDPGYYEALAANFPDFSDHPGMEKNNALIHMSGLHAFAGEIPVDPIWQDFMRVHYSTEFFQQIIGLLGDGVRQSHPNLEDRLGKRLEDLTVQPRHSEDMGADLWIDAQFAINTPVREATSVRCRHVDDPKKLFAGLFYMPLPDDDTVGGELEICRWREAPSFQSVFVQDHMVDLVDTVKYQANTLLVFINSPEAVHGVTVRQKTPRIRRYLNFIAEFREPIFDLQQYQDDSAPWALMMGGEKKR